jgi:hypothetical protein
MGGISKSSINRLSLAKEMFTLGKISGSKNTRTDSMLAILNFDFAITSIIVGCCIEKNIDVKNKVGKIKSWPDILSEFKNHYNNEPLLADVDALHTLRNFIQHGYTIPSNFDIERNTEVVMDFFNDVCKNFYDEAITYDSISIAKLLKSPHEKELMEKVEEFIDKKEYNLALYLIHTLALYHYVLVKTNLVYPRLPDGLLHPHNSVHGTHRDIYDNIDNVADKLAFGKYYSKLKKLLENSISDREFDVHKRYSYDWIHNLKPSKFTLTFDQIEKYRTEIYDILFGTEHFLFDKLIVDVPIVFGTYISEINPNNVTMNFGILSKLPITNCELNLYQCFEKKGTFYPKAKPGYNEFRIDDLEPNQSYRSEIIITQEVDPEFGSVSANYYNLEFTTSG